MSMTKQLWSAILVSMSLALAGSLLASLMSARGYLVEQLTLKNADNANALALSLSHGPTDKVTMELAAAALFDGGQYALVRITDAHGRVIVEKVAPPHVDEAPPWFVSLLPIDVDPGTAQITDGWKQVGAITLESETRFAYASLWSSALQMIAALGLSGVIAGYMGSLILRRLIPPLRDVVNQAQGITERRFSTIAPPRVPELARLAEAMNLMVTRLQLMFEEEAIRLEDVRRQANLDALTGLDNRPFFMARLNQHLKENTCAGRLVLFRIHDLATINQNLGREATDQLLVAIGSRVAEFAAGAGIGLAGRINGADFAFFVSDIDDAGVGDRLLDQLKSDALRFGLDPVNFVHIGSAPLETGADVGIALAMADSALAAAELTGRSAYVVHSRADSANSHPRSAIEWERHLKNALTTRQFRLELFPIVNARNQLVAHEAPLRLRLGNDGIWLPAGQFIPVAERLKITESLDRAAIELGLSELERQNENTAIVRSLSPQSIANPEFRKYLVDLLGQRHRLARRLWLEIGEAGALTNIVALKSLCGDLSPLGCRIGIEHFGHQFGKIGTLYQIGLHYIKMDGSFISGIDHNSGNQAFLRGVRSITRAGGLELHAEGITTQAEMSTLVDLGFDAFTGPAIRID